MWSNQSGGPKGSHVFVVEELEPSNCPSSSRGLERQPFLRYQKANANQSDRQCGSGEEKGVWSGSAILSFAAFVWWAVRHGASYTSHTKDVGGKGFELQANLKALKKGRSL